MDRSEGLYRIGETATFRMVIPAPTDPDVEVEAVAVLSHDGGETLATYPLDLRGGPEFTVTGTLPYPGFLRCTVTLSAGRRRARFLAAAGFEPEKIQTLTELPDDFLAFWEEGRARLAALDPDVRMERIEAHSDEDITAYKISWAYFDSLRMYGFLSVPNGTGPFPALVVIPGAGAGFRGPDTAWARRGVMTLRVNVHPWDPPIEREEGRAAYDAWRKEIRRGTGATSRSSGWPKKAA